MSETWTVSGFEWSPDVDQDLFRAIALAPPRRERPKKPCRWCVDAYALPATHVAVMADGRRVRVCAFHGQFAARRPDVRLYRFRKV